MSILSCPVCGEKLENSGKTYACPNRHSFDIARSGYVNLLLSKHSGGVHGDNKLMVTARRDFLEAGHYEPLREALCRKVGQFAREGSVILDAGCGEGYYTSAIIDRSKVAVELTGIDISKTAVELAAKRKCGAVFAAGSVFHLPVLSGSCDILVTLFAPYCGEEFRRVLKPGGIMIMAIPSEGHLWELKTAIYDAPYKNEVKPYELEGFEFLGSERITGTAHLTDQQQIWDLFTMTPYYYKTGSKEQERLRELTELEVTTDFELLTYRNI
ncbi:MAG: methyltransferase domain-containing protein [Ruminococcus sp.]|nr:methyltransferase domain-containing protein [Ruminococcus sp.]